jgi:hypothetical protein
MGHGSYPGCDNIAAPQFREELSRAAYELHLRYR